MGQVVLFLVVAVLSARAAPQAPAVPYDFSYGVNVVETGDVKEHKETKTAEGRTDGEYRWLQPNGLFRVVRYYVTADSGFVAQVSEEPGPDVPNYYTNSITRRPNTITRQSFRKPIPSPTPAIVNTPRP